MENEDTWICYSVLIHKKDLEIWKQKLPADVEAYEAPIFMMDRDALSKKSHWDNMGLIISNAFWRTCKRQILKVEDPVTFEPITPEIT